MITCDQEKLRANGFGEKGHIVHVCVQHDQGIKERNYSLVILNISVTSDPTEK